MSGNVEAPESYNAERLTATRENITVTMATMRFLVPQDDAAAWHRRELLLAAAADPAITQSVDSGRFAEPFWYVDSPSTTPDPSRPFEGRPPSDATPAPAPGILVRLAGEHPWRPAVTRLRQLLRDGFAVLLGDADKAATVRRALREATVAPIATVVLDQVHGGGDVTRALGMRTARPGSSDQTLTWPPSRQPQMPEPSRGPCAAASDSRCDPRPEPRPASGRAPGLTRPSSRRKENMPYYHQAGLVPPKRHTQHRDPDGHLYYEELIGEEGFSGDSSLLYHRSVPSAVRDFRAWDLGDQSLLPNHPLIPRHLSTHKLFAEGSSGVDAVRGRRLLLGNDDVRLCYVVADAPSPYYRNAIGDECIYVEDGQARVETAFGDLAAGTGDYVIVPRAATYRIVPAGTVRLYVIEASSHIDPPKRYLSAHGQMLEQAPYCERDLRLPAEPRTLLGENVDVYIKHRGPEGVAGTVHTAVSHPFDVVGWDGCLYPYAFNVRDFEPITGRVHQPPPVHQVFEGRDFVVCNFVPRKVDYHPLAIPVPYYHSNVDSDEVMFYCGGNYQARMGSGIGQGSISLHPGGHPHGPQPGAIEAGIGAQASDELAVMVDTFRPLLLGEAARASEDGTYVYSWEPNR